MYDQLDRFVFGKICRHPYGENPSHLPERTNEGAGNYAKASVDVGEECEVPVVDLWTRMQEFPDWSKAYLRYIFININANYAYTNIFICCMEMQGWFTSYAEGKQDCF